MGWLALAAIGAAAFVVLRLIGMPREFGWFAAAALMLGATGYALQQRAGLPGQPVTPAAPAARVDPGLIAFRTLLLPGAAAHRATLAAADEALRLGNTVAAIQGLQRAIDRAPADPTLWTALGSALATHEPGALSPAARFAFVRAGRLAPREPGPPFFLGLAYVQAGDLPAAKLAWQRALALTPPGASYRGDIAGRLAMLDQFQAMIAAARQPR